jgi:cytochrome c biogenesis protein CcmG, thiol:disulfide interchange protein DsbE
MTQRQLTFITIAIVAIIVAASIGWYELRSSHQLRSASQSPIVGKATVGRTAPEFTVSTTEGLFDLAKIREPVFLEIFATWCPHCQREAAVIDRLYGAYGGRVAFVGVSGSDTAMDETSPASQLDVVNWIQKFHVRYPVAFDPALTVAGLYLQDGFPTLVVIDKNKRVTYMATGEVSYGVLATAIKHVL